MFALSLNPPLDVEEEKNTIALTNSEKNNSVSNTYEHNKKFTFYTPRYWEDPEVFEKLENLLDQRKYDRSELHGKNVNRRGLEIEVGPNT